MRKDGRKLYLEFLRIFCIILVIFIHTNERGIDLYTVREYSIFYPIYLFCAVAARGIAVPLFWMISGSLLIPKQETVGTLYKKRIAKFCVTLLVFSFIQELFVKTAVGYDGRIDSKISSFIKGRREQRRRSRGA